jgi:hypothetical protein
LHNEFMRELPKYLTCSPRIAKVPLQPVPGESVVG